MVHHRCIYNKNNKTSWPNKNHRNTVERTWHKLNRCKEMEQEYTGGKSTMHFGQPYLLSNLDELNILAYAMENKLGLRYTTHLINSLRHHKCFNTACNSTVTDVFQPKMSCSLSFSGM